MNSNNASNNAGNVNAFDAPIANDYEVELTKHVPPIKN
jgi:hypothetical protein